MKRPFFVPIVASNLLASIFTKKLPADSVYGFVVEEPSAGGHNAPPRKPVFDEHGRMLPHYGPKDEVDYAAIADLGLPFWIGGSYASQEKLAVARTSGAQGIQVGSIFALCENSGMDPLLRENIRRLGYKNQLRIRTDTRISPTGFPFKVAVLDRTVADQRVYEDRVRVCNHGVLVSIYVRVDGTLGYRCSSEPLGSFVAKGGDEEDTAGRGCICNGLLSTADLNNPGEPPVVTLGDDVSFLQHLMANENDSYTAEDAVKYLLGQA